MRSIFLFANEGYGLPFIEQAAKWNSCNRENLTVILSGKTKATSSRWRIFRRRLRQSVGGLRRQWQWGLPVQTIKDVNAAGFINQVPDGSWGIICGFNQIFRQELIARFHVLVNFHPSLLPLYRGPVPSRWCLRNQEPKSGYSLHRVTPAIDAGEILFQGVVTIAADDTDTRLDKKIAVAAAPVLAAYLDHLKSGQPWRKELVEARSIYRCPVDYASFPKADERARRWSHLMSNNPDLKLTNRLVVAHSVNPWCPASWVYHQLTGLKNFHAIVISKRKEKAEQFPFNPVYAQYDLPWPQRLYEKMYARWTGKWFPTHRRVLRRHEAQLLHSHFCPTGMANWRLARSLRIPHVTTFYGADIWLHSQRPGWREKFLELAANSEMFLVEGNAMRDKVISLGAAPKRVKIFHLGLDLAKIQFSPRRPAPGGKIHILMSGRAYEKKGHIYGLRAFAQLAPKHPRLHLDMIIGGESAKAIKGAAEMREFIRVNNLADRITWSEMLPYDEYLRRLAGAHIFLQPSVMAADGDAEGGFPVTLTEMSAVGVPIVATRHCDIPEAVLHERTGLLASERDVEGLAAHLERLIQTPELWLAYGQAGREHVEANYNIRTTIDVLEDCYRQLLKPAGPSL